MTSPGIKLKPLAAGVALARTIRLLAKYRGDAYAASDEALRYSDTPQVHRALELMRPHLFDASELEAKNAVAVGTTTATTWASPLARSGTLDDFLPLLNAGSTLGAIRQRAKEIPFADALPTVTAAPIAYWVSESSAKAMTSLGLEGVSLPPKKVVALVALSRELVQLSTPSAEAVIRQGLVSAITAAIDLSLFDPTIAGDADQPRSLTYDAVSTASVSSGATVDAIRSDLSHMVDSITSDLVSPTWVMRPGSALRLSLMGLTNDSGTMIAGAPIIRSLGIPDGTVAFMDLASVIFAGGSDVEADASEQASVQLTTTPSDTATNLVSLFQNNLVAIRVELYLNFQMARPGAIVVLTNAQW